MKKNQELGRSMVEMIAVIVLILLLLLCGLWGFKKASLSARMGTINKDISSAIVERRYLNAQGGSRKPHRLIAKVGSTNLQIENLMDGDQFSVLLTNQSKEVCEELKKYTVFTPEKIEVNHIEDGGCLENGNEIELYFDNSSKGSTDLNINPTEKEECVLVFQRKLNGNGCCEEDKKSAQKCAKDITTTCVNTCSLRCLSDGTCGCSSDMDCTDPNTPKCNPATHQCVACLEREKVYPKTLNANGCCVNDTTNGKKCPSEIIATCTSTCTMCQSDGTCGCSSDADCTDPNTPKCEPTTHQCVACLEEEKIYPQTLNANGCCVEDTTTQKKCPSEITTTCTSTCAMCLTDGICGCSSDADCTDPNTPKCEPTTHQCVACLEEEKVYPKTLNVNGCCVEDTTTEKKCPSEITATCTSTCTMCQSDGTCGCSSDADCTDPNTPKCEPTTHQCVACLEEEKVYPKTLNVNGCCVEDTTTEKKCPSEITATCTSTCTMCLPDGICGCSSDADCTDSENPKCDLETHTCGPSLEGKECQYDDISSCGGANSGYYCNTCDGSTIGKCTLIGDSFDISVTNFGKVKISKDSMNWYSAYSWCQAHGKKLIDVDNRLECYINGTAFDYDKVGTRYCCSQKTSQSTCDAKAIGEGYGLDPENLSQPMQDFFKARQFIDGAINLWGLNEMVKGETVHRLLIRPSYSCDPDCSGKIVTGGLYFGCKKGFYPACE